MQEILYRKHQPKSLDDYIFKDSVTETKVRDWVAKGYIPNLLLAGRAGTGKSSLARVLCNELNIDEGDIRRINGSIDNGIGIIRDDLERWVNVMPYGKMRVVIIEEADRLTPATMDALRQITEDTADYVRWIFTANHPQRMTQALLSRFSVITFDDVDEVTITERILDILDAENITYDETSLMSHIDAHKPDIRRIIQSIEDHIVDGNLTVVSSHVVDLGFSNWVDTLETSKVIDYNKARTLTESINSNNYQDYYATLYENSHLFGKKEGEAIVLIAKYLDMANTTSNHRLTIDALLYNIELS